MKSEFKLLTLLDFYRLFLGLGILENILASWYLFSLPSKTRTVFLAGYSLQRIGAGFMIFFVLGIYIFLLYDTCKSQKFLKFLTAKLEIILNIDIYCILIRSSLTIIMIYSLASLLFYLFPNFQELIFQRLIFFLPNDYIFANMGTLAAIIIGWIFLVSLKIFILYSISNRKASQPFSTPVRLMILSWEIEMFVASYFILWSLITQKLSLEILAGPGVKILILSVWFSFWALLNKQKKWADRFFQTFVCISIGLFYLLVSMQFAQWLDNWRPNPHNMFIKLAYSFLHGKLYILPDLLGGTHDLVYHNQHWFVAFPPFPVILMLPFIAIWGIHAFNYTAFSVVLGALGVVVIYLVLDQLIRLGWIKLSRSGAIWLTSLFAFGTVFWWLCIHVTAGFLCQVVTVLTCGLAFLSVLKKYPPWVTGAFLAMAILCRPNVFLLWPALLGITVQLNLVEQEKVNWRHAFSWSVISAIPVILGVGLLACYNYFRFGNFLDFGYATLNGSEFIMENVQTYGVWSLYYVPRNLHYMFIALPQLIPECRYFLPRGSGMSILMTTPALIYILRKFKISWWTGGCWCSILLSIALLALYSNNGANQYGYRYVMDFIVPVIMIIAYNAGEKVSGLLKSLTIASIIINYYGIISWFKSPC
jgi:hypothetical protein